MRDKAFYVFQHIVDCFIDALVFSWLLRLGIFLMATLLGLQDYYPVENYLRINMFTTFCFCIGCLVWLYYRFVERNYQSVLGCFFVWWDIPDISTRKAPIKTKDENHGS